MKQLTPDELKSWFIAECENKYNEISVIRFKTDSEVKEFNEFLKYINYDKVKIRDTDEYVDSMGRNRLPLNFGISKVFYLPIGYQGPWYSNIDRDYIYFKNHFESYLYWTHMKI